MELKDIILIKSLAFNGKSFIGIEVKLPGAPLVLLVGEKGFVMCGYLNIEAANKLDVIAARVTGVKTVEDLIEAVIKEATRKAEDMGIKPGIKVKDILDKL